MRLEGPNNWQAVATWLNWSVDWGLIEESPAAKNKVPNVPKVRKPFLTEEQFASLLGFCPLNTFAGARRQAMLWMMATTRIRRNEMRMLKRLDLDWDKSVIRVVYGKGQKKRQIPFYPRCQRAMLCHILQRWDSQEWLWVTEEDIRLGYRGIWHDLNRLAARAEIELKDACHIFRRAFAANAVKQSIPRPYVLAIAGWPTPQMLDHHAVAMEAEEEAIEAVKESKPFLK